MRAKYFLTLAKQASLKSDHKAHNVGCVIARGTKVLGIGHNRLKTHPKSPHDFKSMHAEFMAALQADYDLRGATVYVFRQQKNGQWAMARPCQSCWRFLLELGAKEVVYSFQGSFRQETMKA